MATLRAEMLDKQMQLAFVDGFASSDESTSSQLRRQVGILEHKLKSLQEPKIPIDSPAKDPSGAPKQPTTDSHNTGGLFPPAMNIPKLQYEVEDLLREQKIQQTLLSLLTERYEVARVNEARDTSTFQILDNPVVPTKKSRPKRMLIAAIACFMGCFAGIVMTIMVHLRANARDGGKETTG
jgi:capsule polysaccharide export protein KpsE/RkpR